ncbi:hypothetical protein PR048_014016 [Dryococelus australis]|uniref:Integrase catalytic domain-containing protein n=1 Tax=Dryococelus australis TaxID=614101 RepID=A0ABQ9HVG0_9NEOP|nr:hypothetical protein PR048_014016 [Dryococelus australis]
MRHLIDEFVKNCNECQLANADTTKGKKVFIDIYSPLPRSRGESNCIFILVDVFSKFTLLLPLRAMKDGNIVNRLGGENVENPWEPTACSFRECELFQLRHNERYGFQWGIKHVNTSLYYPCPNLVERIKRNLMVALGIFHNVDQRNWDENLPDSTGYSPSKDFLGRDLTLIIQNGWGIPPESLENTWGKELEKIWHQTCANLEKARSSVENKYDDRL